MKRAILSVLLIAAMAGCHKKRESVNMSEKDQSKGASKLDEAVRKAGEVEGAASSLRFEFRRGHEMSGVTTFHVDGAGAYSLARTAYKRFDAVSVDGTMTAAQLRELYASLARHDVLHISSSARAIGDSEQPISLHVGDGHSSHDLDIWAKDARDDAQFNAFSTELYGLFETLSDGAIKLRP